MMRHGRVSQPDFPPEQGAVGSSILNRNEIISRLLIINFEVDIESNKSLPMALFLTFLMVILPAGGRPGSAMGLPHSME
jgi:hypothetical protein